ncbi:hypothetical protein P6U16_20910 [Rhizobium sp. 32-5/1]|uniref:hypothetical protein n=1 Tax=Rhizobium sp. 32-5/1 TaxID=3019602 RepID=UPI00240D48A4|nr:hypothetical protein [Rhizobium sp. 32-5/1]WEZ83266.1 hypothetical protein P6U16_20910 [Rhizobium sp. 32-5/1]
MTNTSPRPNLVAAVHGKLRKLAKMGLQERAEARADGVSSYYVDPSGKKGLIEERPNGQTVLTPVAGMADAAE